MLKLLIVCAIISLGFDLGFAEAGEYTTGKNSYQYSIILIRISLTIISNFNFIFSLDRRSCYPVGRFRGFFHRFLERLPEGRTVFEAPGH